VRMDSAVGSHDEVTRAFHRDPILQFPLVHAHFIIIKSPLYMATL